MEKPISDPDEMNNLLADMDELLQPNRNDIPDKEKVHHDKNEEENSDAEEAEIIKHCKYMKSVIDIIGNYDNPRMSAKAKEHIEEVRGIMLKIKPDETETTPLKETKQIPRKSTKEITPGVKNKIRKMISNRSNNSDYSTTDSSSSEDSCTSSQGSSDENSDEPIVHKAKTTNKQNPTSEMSQLTEALKRLDTRRVPEIDDFDEKGSETLTEYIGRFEKYCEENLKGDQSFWIIELGKKLSANTLKAYQAIYDRKDKYKDIRKKLIKYDKNMKETRRQRAKEEFRQMKLEKDENLYLYSIRLEKTFKVSHPNHGTEYSKTLLKKFMSSVPRGFRKLLEGQNFIDKTKKKKTKWSTIQRYATIQDKEERKEKSESEDNAKKLDVNVQQTESFTKNKNYPNNQHEAYGPNNSQNVNYYNKFDHGRNHSSYQKTNMFNPRMPFQNNVRFNAFNPNQRASNPYRHQNDQFRQQGLQNPRWNMMHNSHERNYTRDANKASEPSNNSRQNFYGTAGPRIMPPRILQCNICGRIGHKDSDCKADQQCHLCGKYGHFKKECRSTQQRTGRDVKQCSFCGRLGHSVEECRQKKQAENAQEYKNAKVQSEPLNK